MVDSQRTTDRLTHARAAVFAIFGLNGFLLALWVVHIPAIRERVGIDHAALGSLVLLLALGALVSRTARWTCR